MSDPGKAVFLSYASQDAEAAKRIADALRTSGVEVWFDAEGGLEHGDEWDAKIRRQIKECVLFIPIVSANTEAREEGYFRIEWELAAQRALGIASGVAFILPVVIDDTREQEALVPDRFRTVQWTRLPGGTVPPEVKQRFLKLWSHRAGMEKNRSKEQGAGSREPETTQPAAAPDSRRGINGKWFVAVGLVLFAVAAYLFLPRTIYTVHDAPAKPVAAAATPAPVSPARALVEKAYPLIHALDARREDFALAEDYCQRALKLDPDDGEIWAAYSLVHSAFGYRGWDTSSERREQTRVTAERAIRLAPRSVRARLAQAGAWAAFGVNRDEREKLLREIVSEQPDHQEALRFLAVTVLAKPDGFEEALALNERSAALPGGDPLALFNNARYLWQRGRTAEGFATLQRALAQQKFTSALVLKMAMEINVQGDLVAAEETLRQIPGDALLEDRANYVAGQLRYYQRNGAAALATWQTFPRDFYNDFVYDGPKGLLLGLAHEVDHRDAAARIEWRAALLEVEKRIAAAPNRAGSYYSQAFLLACLGEKVAANEALRTYEQLAAIKYSPGEPIPSTLAKVYARLGRFDEIFARPPATSALFRISPDYDGLRADPRFAAWVAATGASSSAKATEDGSGLASPPDPKSVAILPFANLSADPANAFFADGMHEEVLTTVAKIAALKVIARTSVLPYADANRRNLRQIAAELGVETVLEGSVRRTENRVRIAVQLVEARTSRQLWSETYERPLDDVFGVQTAIAEEIAAHLSTTLSPGERNRLQWRPAPTPEAYQLYLRARVAFGEIGTPSLAPREKLDAAIALFERAAAADPQFALPLVQLAQLHGYLYWFGTFDPTPARAQKAIAVVQKLQELAPDAPETHLALGAVLYYQCRNDWEQALAELRLAQPGLPNDSQLYQWQGFALRRLGRWQPACESFENVLLREPNNVFTAESLVETTRFMRRYAEAARRAEEFLRRFPQSAALRSDGAAARFALDGNPAAYLAALREKPSDAAYQRRHVWDALLYTQRYDEAERFLTAGGRAQLSSLGAVVNDPVALYQAQLAFLRGQPAEAARLAGEARAYYEAGTWTTRQEPFVNVGLAMAAALAGDGAAVERHARRARELLQVRPDAFNASFLPAILGPAFVAAGRNDQALDELRRLVTESGDISPAAVRCDPFWLRLKNDPRFEEILKSAISP